MQIDQDLTWHSQRLHGLKSLKARPIHPTILTVLLNSELTKIKLKCRLVTLLRRPILKVPGSIN